MINLQELFSKIKLLGFNVDSIKFQINNDSYFYGNNNKVNICSSAKTVTAIAFGIAKEKYKIEYNDPIIKYFPEFAYTASSGTDKIKIIDLLNMQSGKKIQSLLQDSGNSRWNSNWLAWFFENPLDFEPGSQFYYSSHCCYVIGRLIEKLSGLDLNNFLEHNLWEPLNIVVPEWGKCPQGFTICAGELMLSCSELFALGQLILGKGTYEGKYICSEQYIDKMTKSLVRSYNPFIAGGIGCDNGYGFFIWKGAYPEIYYAWGAGGTFCIVDYDKNCVLTITSFIDNTNWKNIDDHIILHEVYAFLDKI